MRRIINSIPIRTSNTRGVSTTTASTPDDISSISCNAGSGVGDFEVSEYTVPNNAQKTVAYVKKCSFCCFK